MNFISVGNRFASKRKGWLSLLLLMLFGGLSTTVHAHPESLSNLRLVIGAQELHATLTLPVRDLTRWFPPGRYANYTADVVNELQRTGGTLLDIDWDGESVAASKNVNVHPGKTGFIIAEICYPVPAGGSALRVRSAHLGNLPNDHQQVAWAEDERAGPSTSRVVVEEILTAQQDTLTVELPEVVNAPPELLAVAPSPASHVPAGRAFSFLRGISSVITSHNRLVCLCSLGLVMIALVVRLRKELLI